MGRASLLCCYNQIQEFVIEQIVMHFLQQHRMFQSFSRCSWGRFKDQNILCCCKRFVCSI